MKVYSLSHFGGNRFALSNETDKDVMTDYFPGIWGIDSQKEARRYVAELKEEGHQIQEGHGDKTKIRRILANSTI